MNVGVEWEEYELALIIEYFFMCERGELPREDSIKLAFGELINIFISNGGNEKEVYINEKVIEIHFDLIKVELENLHMGFKSDIEYISSMLSMYTNENEKFYNVIKKSSCGILNLKFEYFRWFIKKFKPKSPLKLEQVYISIGKILNNGNVIKGTVFEVTDTNKLDEMFDYINKNFPKQDLLRFLSKQCFGWLKDFNDNLHKDILISVKESEIENAIEYINDNLKFGSRVNYEIIQTIFDRHNLSGSDVNVVFEELKLLKIEIENVTCDKEKKINTSENSNVISVNNINGKIDEAIDYIYDNVKYGSDIPIENLDNIFLRYDLCEIDKQKIYKELEELKVRIIYPVHLNVKKPNNYNTTLFIDEKNEEDNKKFENDSINELDVDNIKKVNNENKSNNYDFLDDLEDDYALDDILESETFKNRVDNFEIKANKEYNYKYISDVQSVDENKNLNGMQNIASANLNLVWKSALKHYKQATVAFEIDDMVQAGMLGMLKAAERFDLESGNQFSTYATWWINQSISRGIDDYSTLIRLPVHLRDRIKKLIQVENSLWNELGRTPKTSELSEAFGESAEKINELHIYMKLGNLDSLDRLVGEDDNSSLGNFITDEDDTIENIVTKRLLKEQINTMLDTLTPKERNIIVLRFGLIDDRMLTLEEIGEMYNVTRERIRQIEKKALSKLRHPSKSRKLRDYLYN